MTEPANRPRLLPALVYTALSSAIVSSLGMLLVPTVAREFAVPVSTAQWMLTINLLVGAIATPIMGRLSDGPHKKPLLVWALVTVLAGSVIAALAPNFTVFLVGRALQGLTYGIVPVTIALARRYLDHGQVRFAISSLSVTVSTGIGIGYPVTGIIAGLFDFRVAFGFSAVFVVSAVVVAARAIPAGPDQQAPRRQFDLAGTGLLSLGLAALLLGISEGPNWGWGSAGAIGSFLLAAAALAVWVVVELRSAHPLINLRVLRHGEVLLANATAVGIGTAMYIGFSVTSLVSQAPSSTGYGIALPVLWAGFVVFPLSVGSFGANRIVRATSKRVQLASLLPIGAAVVAVATGFMFAAHDRLWAVLVGMFLLGVGIGTSYAAMPALIARKVATAELGSAVSFNQVLRTVGGSFGSAVSGAVLAANLAPDVHPTGTGISITYAIAAIVSAVVFVALLVNLLPRRRTPR